MEDEGRALIEELGGHPPSPTDWLAEKPQAVHVPPDSPLVPTDYLGEERPPEEVAHRVWTFLCAAGYDKPEWLTKEESTKWDTIRRPHP